MRKCELNHCGMRVNPRIIARFTEKPFVIRGELVTFPARERPMAPRDLLTWSAKPDRISE
jgi:hypothetical protein